MCSIARASFVLVVVAGCGGGDGAPDAGSIDAAAVDAPGPAYAPGPVVALSDGAPGNDEDPAVLAARDGSIYVAWYSASAGDDIVISRTTDGVHWTAPAHVSTGAAIDFGPSLYQDAAGYVHAAWFRWSTGAPPGRIVHARSIAPDDGLGWDPAGEVDVTTATATDDWVPSITADASGALVVAYARNTCPPPGSCFGIYASTATSAVGDAWGAPAPVVTAGAGVEHHLPAIANVGGELQIAWDPYDDTAGVPWESAQTGAHVSLIRDVASTGWSDARDVTARDPASVSVFPTLYADHAGAWFVAWLAAGASGQAVVEVPLDAIATAPSPLPIDGYSPRIAATPTPGVFLAAWVGGAPDEREIDVRVFEK